MKYVGQSIQIEERFMQHIEGSNSSKIHEAIEEYGVSNFKFEIIVECLPNELDEQEVKFIRLLDTYNNGYNQTRGGQHSVFNAEHDYTIYVDIKEKLKAKNEIITSLKKQIKCLKDEVNSLKNENARLIIENKGLIRNIEKDIEIDVPKSNIFHDLLVQAEIDSRMELVE